MGDSPKAIIPKPICGEIEKDNSNNNIIKIERRFLKLLMSTEFLSKSIF